MKRIISLFLALLMLVSALSLEMVAEAASKPAKVTVTSAVVTVDRFKRKSTYKLQWKKVKGVTGYQIKVGEGLYDEDGYYWHTTKKIKGASKTTYKAADTYNAGLVNCAAKVRAYKKKNGKTVYGKWSKVKKTKVKYINQVTGLKGEVVDTHHDAKKLKLTWNSVKGADGYQIVYTQWTGADMDEQRKINVKGTSYTGWMGYVGLVHIRWYKIVDGKKKYSDYSTKYLDFTPDYA